MNIKDLLSSLYKQSISKIFKEDAIMKILITAVGSMSAECAIKNLTGSGNYVVGCDIYPKEWHYETTLCDKFYQAPFATDESEYVHFLLDVCREQDLEYIIPLTDLEIDVINRNRRLFNENGITLCMQSEKVLDIVRNKYKLYKYFENDNNVPSVKTCLLVDLDESMTYPCIAKPYNGRSSEGLIRNASKEQVLAIADKGNYIIQEQIEGNVFTVDYCRSSESGTACAVPRQELLRTKNGAGLTVETSCDENLIKLVSYIGCKLDVNGCVNMEFIKNGGKYYLIDINPRFSAGISFSVMQGYDMVNNHVRCFTGEEIDGQIDITEHILIKKYQDVAM